MKTVKNFAGAYQSFRHTIGLFWLVVAILALPITAQARIACPVIAIGDDELAAHQSMLTENKFNTRRDLKAYRDRFGIRFSRAIDDDRTRHWYNQGGGQGIAERQWLALYPGRHATNVTFNANSTDQAPGYRLLTGRYVEAIPQEEIEPAQVGSDMIGAVSYSRMPEVALAKLNGWLTADGSGFIAMNRHRWDMTTQQTFVLCRDRAVRTFAEWIRDRSGLKVVSISEYEDLAYQTMQDVVEFAATPGVVMPSLTPLAFASGAPPLRIFAEQGVDLSKFAQKANRNYADRVDRLLKRHGWLTDPVAALGDEPPFRASVTFAMARKKAPAGSLWLDINLRDAPVTPWKEKLERTVVESVSDLKGYSQSARFVTDSRAAIWRSDDIGKSLNSAIGALGKGGSLLLITGIDRDDAPSFVDNTIVIKKDGKLQDFREYLDELFMKHKSWLEVESELGWRPDDEYSAQYYRMTVKNPSQVQQLPSLRVLFDVRHRYEEKKRTTRYLVEQ